MGLLHRTCFFGRLVAVAASQANVESKEVIGFF